MYFISAQTGEIIAKWDALVYDNISGTVAGDYKPEFIGDATETAPFPHER